MYFWTVAIVVFVILFLSREPYFYDFFVSCKDWVKEFISRQWKSLRSFSALKQTYIIVSSAIGFALFILFIALYYQLFNIISGKVKTTISTIDSNFALAFLGTVTGGVALFTGFIAILRSETNERQTYTAEQGLITDSINKATEGLGKSNQKDEPVIELRIGALYALEQTAQDSERDHIRIMKIFCAYIRINSPIITETDERGGLFENIKPDKTRKDDEPQKIRDDIHEAITIIGRREEWLDAKRRIEQEHLKGYYLDLSQCDLHGVHLDKADLRNAQFDKANLQGAHLEYAKLIDANLERANLTNAKLSRADMTNCMLSRANLNGAILTRANLSYAQLDRASLISARLGRAKMVKAILEGANLSDAWLNDANMESAWLIIANLSNARMRNANLCNARLSRANLSNARLNSANLSGALLDKTDLTNTLLDRTNMTGARLNGANMNKAFLMNTDMKDALTSRTFAHTSDFSDCKNLTQKQLDVMFCGKNVAIPNDLTRPEHWPTEELSEDAFMDVYNEWLNKERHRNPRMPSRRALKDNTP